MNIDSIGMWAYAIRSAFIACALAVVAAPARPQEPYPAKPIHMIVPYPAGASGADILARLLGQRISERWKVPVVVENRPGASSVPGHDAIAKAKPDGYTMGFSATSFSANVGLVKLPYDPIKSFEQVVLVATNVVSFDVANAVPAKTLAEFIALARRQPGKLNYASPGNGTPQHLAMELFKLETGVDIVNVPYKSSSGALADLVGGQVQCMVIPLQTAAPQVQSGGIRMLAVMSAQRSSAFPDVPTMRELGLPALEVDTWYGIFAPAGTPPEIVKRWNSEINALLAQPDIRQSLEKQGLIPAGGPPERFKKLLQEDIARWLHVVRAAGIKAD